MTLLAAAQFAPGDDPGANLANIRRLARAAVARGARLVAFPEYSSWFRFELGPWYREHAEPLDGPFVAGLAVVARETGAWLVAGTVEAPVPGSADDRVSNTLVALDPAGELVATYRKAHLYDAFGARESEWIRPGDLAAPATFDVDGLTVGLQTCYDLRFPEVTRRLVDAGAEVVVVPAEWVRGPLKEGHWELLVRARAVENTVYVVAADQTPPVGVGASAVVDPMGVVLAAAGEQEGLALAEADRARLEAVRAVNPCLELRRYAVVPRA